MPCEDVTESLEIVIDEESLLCDYRLTKRTCGRAVGEQDLILPYLKGKPAEKLAELDVEEFLEGLDIPSDEELVLTLKHFFAVTSGIRVLIGKEPGSALDPVRVAQVNYEDGGYHLEAEVVVDIITEQIASCGKCKGCGSLKKLVT